MRIIAVILLATVAMLNTHAQKDNKYTTKNKKAIAAYREGEDLFMLEKYTAALQKFDQALQLDPKFVECYFMKADIFGQTGNLENRLDMLNKGVTTDSAYFPQAYYLAGVTLCKLARANEAVEWFELYKKFCPEKRQKKDLNKWLEHALFVKNLIDNPVPFEPRPIHPNISSEFDLYWPSLTLDESEIVFTALLPKSMSAYAENPHMPMTPRNFQEDFYISQKKDGVWQALSAVPGINTVEYNEGAQALSPDGQWMFFTGCNWPDGKGSCDLYFSRRTTKGWSKPVNIGAPINTSHWESQPCFSADGQTLYFVSNRPGGKGGNDIYMSKITAFDSEGIPVFGDVVNMGDSVNTKGHEASPFIHPDNKTLYFSSDGWPGLGKMDIFICRRDSATQEWLSPTNMGYPINTAEEEIGLVISSDGTTGYYSQGKKLADGRTRKEPVCFSLAEKLRPQPIRYITGNVYDAETRRPLGSTIELLNLATSEKLVTAQSNPNNGKFAMNNPRGENYALISQCNGYLFFSMNFAMADTVTKKHIDVPMQRLKIGGKVALRNIFFETDKADLKEESFVELDKLVTILKENATLKVEIGGHTDNVGSAQYNMGLSNRRAATTASYLVSKGINAGRISSKGYGLTMPAVANDTEENRALNRRIEVKIIGM